MSYPKKALSVLGGENKHQGAVFALRFTGNGQYCMTAGQDKIVRLWNPKKSLLIKRYSNVHGYEIRDVVIHPDNSQFASAGGDRAVFVWDVSTGRVIRRIRGHEAVINSMCYNSDCSVLVTGSKDQTVRCWDLRSHARDPIQVMKDAKDSIAAVVVSDALVFSGCVDGCLRTYDIRAGNLVTDNFHHPISSVRMSNDKNCVLVGTLDSKLRLVDKENGDVLNEYSGHEHEKYIIKSCFSFDDAYVASGSEDNQVLIWDLVEAKCVTSLRGHRSMVTCVEYHPTEHTMLSSDAEGVIKYWGRVD